MDSNVTYAEIVLSLSRAQMPVRQLHGRGHVLVVPAAGRIVAMAFTSDGPNIFWSHPDLGSKELVRNSPSQLVGNLGGDRLWFAPEMDYFWDGIPDWRDFSNYRIPAEADPGGYRFVCADPQTILLRSVVQLRVRPNGHIVTFSVERSVRMTSPPIALEHSEYSGVKYVGIHSSHTIAFEPTTMSGRVGLWHLLQVPMGSLLILPLRSAAKGRDRAPLLYSGSGGWLERSDCLLWNYGGNACTKFGISASSLTGLSGILRPFPFGQLCLIVRQFAVDPRATYADHPHNVPRTDQAFQVWDGFGFGEMEYHSPMLDAKHGPRVLRESDHLWAFAGPPNSIRMLAEQLLRIENVPAI